MMLSENYRLNRHATEDLIEMWNSNRDIKELERLVSKDVELEFPLHGVCIVSPLTVYRC